MGKDETIIKNDEQNGHTTAMEGGSANNISLHGYNLLDNAGAIVEEQLFVRTQQPKSGQPQGFAYY